LFTPLLSLLAARALEALPAGFIVLLERENQSTWTHNGHSCCVATYFLFRATSDLLLVQQLSDKIFDYHITLSIYQSIPKSLEFPIHIMSDKIQQKIQPWKSLPASSLEQDEGLRLSERPLFKRGDGDDDDDDCTSQGASVSKPIDRKTKSQGFKKDVEKEQPLSSEPNSEILTVASVAKEEEGDSV